MGGLRFHINIQLHSHNDTGGDKHAIQQKQQNEESAKSFQLPRAIDNAEIGEVRKEAAELERD
jgi:hypothetical protein